MDCAPYPPQSEAPRPDLRLFRYALAIADEGGFGHAAARLGISQPPLSQRIAELESALGVRLFDRKPNGTQPTAAGRVFLAQARVALDAAHKAIDCARAAGRGEEGELRLALSGGAMFRFLPPLLRQFRDAHPRVRLTIRSLAAEEQIARVADGRFDVGITRLTASTPEIELQEVHREGFVAALPVTAAPARRTSISLTDLRDQPFVMFQQEGSGFHAEVLALCHQAGFVPRIAQEIAPMHAVLGLVEAGFGVAVVPESVRVVAFPGVTYRRLRGLGTRSRLYVAARAAMRSPQCDAFISHLLAARDPVDPVGKAHGTVSPALYDLP
jgi:DNA-binding transcriptional LysR family regulator